ncbi:ribosome recycling factor [Candidatus Peregrinibacteria bacterium]|nr:ribosome recycling factor [Candidatus Peregrinibacteria bacterium]
MSTDQAISEAISEFEKAISHLKEEFSRLQVGRANPSLIENIPVDVYGSSQPLKAVASISVPESRSLLIQPWDRGSLAPIEKAIVGVGLGLNPINDGQVIRINIPPLTEERRAELTKRVRQLAETAHIAIRNGRQDAHNAFKQLKADSEITEDDLHTADKRLQDKVDDFNKQVDELTKAKEQDVMTV